MVTTGQIQMQSAGGMAFSEGQHALGSQHIKAECTACAKFGESDVEKSGNTPIQNSGKSRALPEWDHAMPRKAPNGHNGLSFLLCYIQYTTKCRRVGRIC